ncbi:hypothetical protein M3Y97_00352700 [Aphelenchoides bicaudatus]|nr:hypothetical protein M3Y97_00352700 [Aphelenchoides bicaudatus]
MSRLSGSHSLSSKYLLHSRPFSLYKKSDLSDVNKVCNHLRGFNASYVNFNSKTIAMLEHESVLEPSIPTHLADKTYADNGGQGTGTDHFTCEQGWAKHGTHCFKVFKQKVHHAEAQKICQNNQATLAVPHEDRSVQFLAKIVYNEGITDEHKNNFFWIGLYIENKQTLKTSDGTNANYFRWLPLGHKRDLIEAFKHTPTQVGALASSPSNTGSHVGVFGYNQVINGNFHKHPFVCQKIATSFGKNVYVPNSVLNKA